MEGWPTVTTLLQGGLGGLAAYLAAHVLLCLLPAFFIAGAMTALIPKSSITRFLGRSTPRVVSYPAAAAAGSLLAVCSCTIVPLFAGIYRKGAGIGPAITFLFFAPAANILALIYTGGVIGVDLAIARLLLSLLFGIGIGLIMAKLFQRQDLAHDQATDALFAPTNDESLSRPALLFLLAWVALLLAGTLKIGFLTGTYFEFHLPLGAAPDLQARLDQWVPFDASRGEEGVSVQGAILILLLGMIAITAWRGLETIQEGVNGWTRASVALVALTFLIAALAMRTTPEGMVAGITGRFLGVALTLAALAILSRRLDPQAVADWLWESWRFMKQIFPLLVAGVFIVGILRQVIQPEWIEALAGHNSLTGNLAGVAFGVFMYFPTLVEVPIARMFLDLGMHRGPLLAYLMADPELSLQSILIISAIIGRLRAWTYVGLVAIFSATAGWIYGAWSDGAQPWLLLTYGIAAVTVLTAAVRLAAGRQVGHPTH